MKLLLDTNAFMWWDSDLSQLSAPALTALHDPANEVWFSVVNVWEMVIKAQLGKLALRVPLADIVAQQQSNGLRTLDVTVAHVLAVESLPPSPQGSIRSSPPGSGQLGRRGARHE
jgi:PIN domain nuclease of toxin-antitoxin system